MVTLTTVATWPRAGAQHLYLRTGPYPIHGQFSAAMAFARQYPQPWSPRMNWNLVFVIALIVLVLIYMGSGPHYGTFTSAHFRAGRF